ncbi:MAG TPA: MarR family transcriptional regulator [Methanothrix sp.]|jgi:DNA-binding transcriptional regulator GbsR (MarR family)|nr:MarR family transcriptional regulator [Methanothrix sp.]HPC88749.1 MarR family transcriptional regulator [Methanothrix sp.]HQE86815.1 MarR family transcriptional regulator [Methanothrix sp.]HQI68097.1 MarR family transcriptional regulator [Methanothrix sp.]HRS84667.1 MarR family transcriptional regulator [Methanothrix sp.]
MDQEDRDILKRYMIDACVKVANNSGCCDAVGVLRGTLFLAEGPLSMDQLAEDTGYSKSTVSSNMSTLERKGLAKRVVVPGDKRYYYIPVTEPDSLKRDLLANMRHEMQIIIAAMDRTEVDLKAANCASPEALERIEGARRFYRQTDLLLDLMSRYNTEELIDLLQRGLKNSGSLR